MKVRSFTAHPTMTAEQAAKELEAYVKEAQAGDHKAFEELVNRTHRLLRKVALPLLPASAVDDVLQETYILMYRKLHYLKRPEAFRAWITRIALNVCYNWRRKVAPVEELEPEAVAGAPDPEPLDVVAIRSALSELKDKDRNIIILREYLAMSYEEIAEALDLAEGTVRSRLFYARKKLKDLLEKSEFLQGVV